MSWEERCLPQYRMFSPYWDVVVEDEYTIRLHSFFPTSVDCEPPDWWLEDDDFV